MFMGANVLIVRASLYHTTGSDTFAAFTTMFVSINAATTTTTTTTWLAMWVMSQHLDKEKLN